LMCWNDQRMISPNLYLPAPWSLSLGAGAFDWRNNKLFANWQMQQFEESEHFTQSVRKSWKGRGLLCSGFVCQGA
jgi:hypothetical protein